MSDAYLLDTSIASIAWDGDNPNNSLVRQKLTTLASNSLFVCPVSLGEVEYGLQIFLGIDQERHDQVRQAMQQYSVLDINKHTAKYYAEIRGELFKKYAPKDRAGRVTKKRPEDLLDVTTSRELGIQENDLWIVSVAIQYDLFFITQDKMQFIFEITDKLYAHKRYEVWNLRKEREGNNS